MLLPLFRWAPSSLAAAVLALGTASALHVTVEKPHFTCEGASAWFSHTAYIPADKTLPCCDGKIGCAQFLSTYTVLHGASRWHS